MTFTPSPRGTCYYQFLSLFRGSCVGKDCFFAFHIPVFSLLVFAKLVFVSLSAFQCPKCWCCWVLYILAVLVYAAWKKKKTKKGFLANSVILLSFRKGQKFRCAIPAILNPKSECAISHSKIAPPKWLEDFTLLAAQQENIHLPYPCQHSISSTFLNLVKLSHCLNLHFPDY